MTRRSVSWSMVLAALVATAVGCGAVTPARRGLWSAVEAKREQLNQCYEQAVAHNPSAAGTMVMWLEVSEDNGQVSNVEVENNGVPDDSLAPCVTSTLQAIRLSEPPPIALRVEYTFEFRVASAAPPPPAVPADNRPPPPPAVPAGG